MIKKLIKGSAYLFALAFAAVLSLFAGNKGEYVLSTADSGGIPVAHADVPHTPDATDPGFASGDSGAGAGCGGDSGDGGCGP